MGGGVGNSLGIIKAMAFRQAGRQLHTERQAGRDLDNATDNANSLSSHSMFKPLNNQH